MVQDTPMETILVVDDDIPLAQNIAHSLKEAGYQPLLAHTAEDGAALALSQAEPELILLDIMIPRMGGIEACAAIRQQSTVPIVFLTALDDVDTVVKGLEVGADDYLVKPYEERELLARIKAHLRRIDRSKVSDRLIFRNGELIINLTTHRVQIDGQDIDLTPREYSLLATLARDAGRVITTSELIQTAWGSQFKDSTDNIKPYIHYLRKKIERDPAAPQWIMTVRGVGYLFADT
jgi:DNA-binding response OmpR family regulator